MKKIIEAVIEFVENSKLVKVSDKNRTLDFLRKSNLFDDCNISMNSKETKQGDIFFAINSGNSYVEEVINRGASIVFYDRDAKIQSENLILVENSIEAMQSIANIYRKKCNFEIVGITGSNGKTTTKDILYNILKQQYKVVKTQGNLNNHIGVPYTILNTPENFKYLVLEMGMSDFGEIDLLCRIAEPNYGIITNIGLSHIEYLKTRSNVFRAKGEMIKYIPKERLFLNSDDEFLVGVAGNKVGSENGIQENLGCKNYIITDFSQGVAGSVFFLNSEKYTSNLFGYYNASNCGLAVALAKEVGISYEKICKGLNSIEITPMRFQKLIWEDIEVINDAYNASPVSTKLALETFSEIYRGRLKVAILGDMLELGEEEDKYHIDVLEEALQLGYTHIYLYGKIMEKVKSYFLKNGLHDGILEYFENKEDIKKSLRKLPRQTVVLLKGSRGMKLEEILK